MLEKSSTPLFMDGDTGTKNPIYKWRYRRFHAKRLARVNKVPFHREVFWPQSAEDYTAAMQTIPFGGSPTRYLCNLFWNSIDWSAIKADLGALTFHDLGCGSGRYSAIIGSALPFPFHYYGYDVQESSKWAQFSGEDVHFATYNGTDFQSTFIHEPNIFVSQSALEHVPQDLEFMRAVARYAENKDRLLQIHLVPGATGLKQWKLHGWRHFDRDTLRLYESVLGDGMTMTAIAMGGNELTDLHVRWMHDRRRRSAIDAGEPEMVDNYRREWNEAMSAAKPAGVDRSGFVAIVIEKGLSEPAWPRLFNKSAHEAATS